MSAPDRHQLLPVKSWRETPLDALGAVEPFLLFVAADLAPDDSGVLEWARSLIRHGCRVLVAWGPNCQQMENEFDWACVLEGQEAGHDDVMVMTTSHPEDSPEQAAWDFLRPMSAFCENRKFVFVIEERQDWVARIERILIDPDEFCSRFADDDAYNHG